MTSLPRAIFYIPDQAQVSKLEAADMDRDWQQFSTGVQVWIGQTYLRLRAAGYPVTLQSTPPDEGVVVVHADHAATLFAQRSLLSKLTVVVTRADRPAHPYADVEIVQNMYTATGGALHVQHWPQPGLIARDEARGSTMRNIAFKGNAREMADEFQDAEWLAALEAEGMVWRPDAALWGEPAPTQQANWNDYREIDAIIALRQNTSHQHVRKPASKLVNAWLAGVPAILGPEVAYTELGRPGVDYLQVSSPTEALQALRHLKQSPAAYQDIVRQGRQRAAQVGAEAVTRRWAELLFDEIPRLHAGKSALLRHLPRSLRSRARTILPLGR